MVYLALLLWRNTFWPSWIDLRPIWGWRPFWSFQFRQSTLRFRTGSLWAWKSDATLDNRPILESLSTPPLWTRPEHSIRRRTLPILYIECSRLKKKIHIVNEHLFKARSLTENLINYWILPESTVDPTNLLSL